MPGIFYLSVLEIKRKEIKEENIRRRNLREHSDPMNLSDSSFVNHFRINKTAFNLILRTIGPYMIESSIPETLQLAAVIRFLAVGASQRSVANDFHIGLGRSTLSTYMWSVIKLLEDKVCPRWIQLQMSEEETIASKLHFFEKYGLPNVIGCVDGTHIRIIKPKDDESIYLNRKGYFSLNAMIVCDYKMKIRAVNASRGGSSHDAIIWRLSEVRQHFQEMYRNGSDNIILGDSGYALEPFVLTPYRSPTAGSGEHVYNRRHTSARNIVERTIGNLKSRFRCLLSAALHYSPPKIVQIINVCCALHNICKEYNICDSLEPSVEAIADEEEATGDDDVNNDNEFQLLRENAIIIRNRIANSLINN